MGMDLEIWEFKWILGVPRQTSEPLALLKIDDVRYRQNTFLKLMLKEHYDILQPHPLYPYPYQMLPEGKADGQIFLADIVQIPLTTTTFSTSTTTGTLSLQVCNAKVSQLIVIIKKKNPHRFQKLCDHQTDFSRTCFRKQCDREFQ